MENILYNDIVLLVCKFIYNEKDIINFLSACKYLNDFKGKIIFNSYVLLEKVHHLWYYDNFTTIKLTNLVHKRISHITHLPKNIQKLTITDYAGSLDFIENSILTHLYVLKNCNINTSKIKFPHTLQYLTWNIKQKHRFPAENIKYPLKELNIANYRNKSLVVPASVKTFILNDYCCLKYIEMPQNFHEIIINWFDVKQFVFPNNLHKLHINCISYFLPHLPNNLYQLTIGKNCDTDIDVYLSCNSPINIEVLILKSVADISCCTFTKLKKILIDEKLINASIYTSKTDNSVTGYLFRKFLPRTDDTVEYKFPEYIQSLNLGVDIELIS